eukprot:3650838-Amphidinium_carterae.1
MSRVKAHLIGMPCPRNFHEEVLRSGDSRAVLVVMAMWLKIVKTLSHKWKTTLQVWVPRTTVVCTKQPDLVQNCLDCPIGTTASKLPHTVRIGGMQKSRTNMSTQSDANHKLSIPFPEATVLVMYHTGYTDHLLPLNVTTVATCPPTVLAVPFFP